MSWLIIMAKLVIVGSGSVMLCSMGYSTAPSSPLIKVMSLLGLGFVVLFTFIPTFLEGKVLVDSNGNAIIDTEQPEDDNVGNKFLRYLMVVLGAFLVLMSLHNILDRLIPQRWIEGKSIWKKMLTGGTVYMERNMKKAAAYKINDMIRNSMAVHKAAEFEHGNGAQKETSYGRALLTFVKKADDLEQVGGWWWTWKRLFNGKIFTEDGIWLNNRYVS